MNLSIKKLCLFSLCDSVGQIMTEQGKNETTKWRGLKLHEAGELAIKKCNIKVDKPMLKKVSEKINEVYEDGKEVDILNALLFLLVGLCDLNDNGSNDPVVDLLIRRTDWAVNLWDKKLNKIEAYDLAVKMYERWRA